MLYLCTVGIWISKQAKNVTLGNSLKIESVIVIELVCGNLLSSLK